MFTREDLEDALAKKANPLADRQWAHDHVFIQLVEVYKVQQNPTAQ
jgi:hypothetical protein